MCYNPSPNIEARLDLVLQELQKIELKLRNIDDRGHWRNIQNEGGMEIFIGIR